MRPVIAALVLLALPVSTEAQSYDWDALGAEFCRLSTAGDLAGLQTLMTPSLFGAIAAANGHPEMPAANVLFQAYKTAVPECRVATKNAALVEVTRSNAGGGAPAWKDYLVVVPERDGTTRIDDILFTTRRGDTLRARLDYFAANR